MTRLAAIVLLMTLLAMPAGAQFFSAPDFYNIVVAAQKDNVKDVETFLAKNVSPNLTDPSGRTALSWAAQSNNTEIAQMVLNAGAKPDLRDKDGNTPLHYAAGGGHIEVMQLLIKAHATIDYQNREGVTPLMKAAGTGRPQAVRVLLDAGADPRKQDFTGRDAVGWAKGRPAVVEMLKAAQQR